LALGRLTKALAAASSDLPARNERNVAFGFMRWSGFSDLGFRLNG
jgi:hypothetical protein